MTVNALWMANKAKGEVESGEAGVLTQMVHDLVNEEFEERWAQIMGAEGVQGDERSSSWIASAKTRCWKESALSINPMDFESRLTAAGYTVVFATRESGKGKLVGRQTCSVLDEEGTLVAWSLSDNRREAIHHAMLGAVREGR